MAFVSSSHRIARNVSAAHTSTTRFGIVTLAVVLCTTLGISPALAQGEVNASPSPTATATAAPTAAATAAPKATEPQVPAETNVVPSATDDPLVTEPAPTEVSAPSAEAPADVERFGAYMGIGLAKGDRSEKELLRSTMAEPPFPGSIAAPLTASPPSGIQGLDVSGWQADSATHSVSQVNWATQWSLGGRFVYIKATEGKSFKDAANASHSIGAMKMGMLTGGYHFALPNESDAVTQADFFVANGGGWSANGKTLPPLLDIENNPYGANCYGLSQAQMVDWISKFSKRVATRTGRLPMIYTNYYWWVDCTGNSSAFSQQPLHMAAYGTQNPLIPGSWASYNVWQYSDSGPFAGDSNVWNGTLATLQTFAKSTQMPKLPAPAIPSAADIVAADAQGTLWRYPATGNGFIGTRVKIGSGWTNIRSINVIDWNSDGVLDMVAQWTNGKLSYYQGKNNGEFAPPYTLAGSGWSGQHLSFGYWKNGNRYPQILSLTADGRLLYITNDSGRGLGKTTQIGAGWLGATITMVDFDGDGNQDLLAQDSSGTVRLYRSNGATGFIYETRKTVATNATRYTSVSVVTGFASTTSIGLIKRNRAGVLEYSSVPGDSTLSTPKSVSGPGWSSMLIAGGEDINILQKPQKPSKPTASPGDAVATVKVLPSTTGSPTATLVVTASPGGTHCTATLPKTSCVVRGLRNGTAYTFTAIAKNSAGSSPSSSSSAAVTPQQPVSRLAGSDRYKTAAVVSAATFPSGVSAVYLANGSLFPDALSGAPAAAQKSSPVLLTKASQLPAATLGELKRLRPATIYVLGSAGVVSDKLLKTLRSYAPRVVRLAGGDRYATSAAISKASFASGTKTVYLANGTLFPDATSGAAAAAKFNGPVLLTKSSSLPPAISAELKRLRPQNIVVLGSAAVISDRVKNQLLSYANHVTRQGGSDRYATSSIVSKSAFGAGADVAYIANGLNFPDALAGAAAAGLVDGPVLLTRSTGLSPDIKNELIRLKPKRVVILGSAAVVSSTVEKQLRSFVP